MKLKLENSKLLGQTQGVQTGVGINPLLTEIELEDLFVKYNTSDVGRTRIKRIRNDLPSRVTKTNRFSSKLRYPSRKMGFVLEAEAFETEFVALVEWEHDRKILEIYPQPEPLKLNYKSKKGRQVTAHTTPDAFLITDKGFVFVECKTEEFLLNAASQQPERFIQDVNGRWRSPPAEEAAKVFGCNFEVRSSKLNNYVLFENLELLQDFLRKDLPEIDQKTSANLFSRIAANGFVSAFDLIHTSPFFAADDLYIELIKGGIYFPICDLRLTDQDTAFFYRDEVTWRAHQLAKKVDLPDRRKVQFQKNPVSGDTFSWDGRTYEVLNPGQESITARSISSEPCLISLSYHELEELQHRNLYFHSIREEELPAQWEKLKTASPAEIQEAVWRYQVLFGVPDDTNILIGRKPRIKALWRQRYREAEELLGNGFLGLLTKKHGNRKARVSANTKELANQVIADDWESIRRKGRITSFGRYLNLAAEQGIETVSYVTFCHYVKERSGHHQDVQRIGEKAAYINEPQYLELDRTTPRHGTRVWHIGHIDHTPLPLNFVDSSNRQAFDTVWLTLLLDANTRKIKAYYLSFDEPSYRSCMMVLRDCVRRHGRAHQIIVSDGAPEFGSIYYEQLLARLEATKRERKLGKPRYGSVCERVFNTSQAQFVTNLLGGNDIVENYFRSISPEVNPARHAVWILDRFDTSFETYLNEIYHTAFHSGIDMSPNDAEALSLRSHGVRSFRPIPYNEDFIAQTCPQCARGEVKVQPAGVKINYLWYKSDVLNQPGILGSSIPGRYDPWNAGLAYIYLKGKWIRVYSEYYSIFKRFTERQMQAVTQSLLVTARKRNKKAVINAQNLAHFLLSIEGMEIIAQQERRDREAERHRQKVNMLSESEKITIGNSYSKFPSNTSETPPTREINWVRSDRILEDL